MRTGPNILIVFSGKPGTGKTTVARKLARDTGIAYLDYDTLVQPFLCGIEKEYGLGESRLDFYRKWRQQSYGTLIAAMRENISLNCPLIVSAPFSAEMMDPSFFSSLREEDLGTRVISFHMVPDDAVHLEMLQRRSSYRDEEILENWEGYLASHRNEKPLWNADAEYEIVFSDTEEAYKAVLSAIDEYKKIWR